MATENGIHTEVRVKEERHSPTENHDGGGITEHHNGHAVDSEDYDSDDSMEAPLDFSMRSSTQNGESDNNHRNSNNVQKHRQSSERDSREFDRVRSKSGEGDGDSSCSSSSQDQIGEPNTVTPSSISFSAETLASLGMMPGLKRAGIVPNANLLASLPNMSAFYDPRGKHHFNSKSARPFKSYPKDSMSLPLGYYGVPGCVPLPNVDQSTIANINKTTEELYDMYKQQLVKIHDLESKKRHRGAGLPPLRVNSQSQSCSPTSPSPPPLAIDTSGLAVASTSPSDYPNVTSPASDSSTPSRGRKRARSLPDEQKDQAYWERRRKNNEAAKRSRDARRAKEDEIAIRAALLEQENLKLRVEVASLKNETAKLRCMLFNGN